jgi:putative flippase GtrA
VSSRRARLRSGGLRFSKFSVVGVSNAVVDIGTLNLLLWLEPTREPWQLALYNALALLLANLNSYVWNSLWTFRGRAAYDRRQTVLFTLQALVNMGVSNGLFWLLVRVLIGYQVVSPFVAGNAAKLVSVAIASTISFFTMRYLVFSRRRYFKGRL